MIPAGGQTVTGFIEVPAVSEAGSMITVAVIRGAKSGPTLALVAGVVGTAQNGDRLFPYLLGRPRFFREHIGRAKHARPQPMWTWWSTDKRTNDFVELELRPFIRFNKRFTFFHRFFTSAIGETMLSSLQPLNWCCTRKSEGR